MAESLSSARQLDSHLNHSSAGDPEVVALLSLLGLDRYAEVLAAEDVDMEALRLMNEQDLADLGLTKGPRVKILNRLK
jgi:hypothetical protein